MPPTGFFGPMEIIENGGYGTFFKNGDAADCAMKIKEIITDYAHKISQEFFRRPFTDQIKAYAFPAWCIVDDVQGINGNVLPLVHMVKAAYTDDSKMAMPPIAL